MAFNFTVSLAARHLPRRHAKVSVAQRVKAASRRILLAAALQDAAAGVQKIWSAVASEARHRSQAQENGASPEKVSEIRCVCVCPGVPALPDCTRGRGRLYSS